MNHGLALIFSGGGSQYIGMGKFFYDQYPEFRSVMDEASDVLHSDIKKVCFEGDLETLSNMNNSQVAIFTISVAMYRVLQSVHNFQIQAMAGHSLGEYSALTSAGVFDLGDGLSLVQKRGELLHEVGVKKDGAMMAVNGLTPQEGEQIVEVLRATGLSVFISNFNSPKQFVLSGDTSSIVEAEKNILLAGGSTQILPIPTCSHCSLMEDAKSQFSDTMKEVKFGKMNTPVYANISGKAYATEEEVQQSLLKHLVQPVLWEQTIKSMITDGTRMMLEIGPQSVLKSINHFIDDSIPTLAFDNASDRFLMDTYFEKKDLMELSDHLDRVITASVCQPNFAPSDKAAIKEISRCVNDLIELKEQLNQTAEVKSEVINRSRNHLIKILEGKGLKKNGIDAVLQSITC